MTHQQSSTQDQDKTVKTDDCDQVQATSQGTPDDDGDIPKSDGYQTSGR